MNKLTENFLEVVYSWFRGYDFKATPDDNQVYIKFNAVPDDDLLGLIDAIGQEYEIIDQTNNGIEVMYTVKDETKPDIDIFDDIDYWEYDESLDEDYGTEAKLCPNCDAELEYEDGHYYCPICSEVKQDVFPDADWEDIHKPEGGGINFVDNFADGPLFEDDEEDVVTEEFHKYIDLDRVIIDVSNMLDESKLGKDWIEVFPVYEISPYKIKVEVTGPDENTKKAVISSRDSDCVEFAFYGGASGKFCNVNELANFIKDNI